MTLVEPDGLEYTLPDGCNGSDGWRVIKFIETFCRQTRGRNEGNLLVLKAWQKQLLIDIFATVDGVRMYRRGLAGMPRKNSKSALGSGIALYALVADGEAGAEVYSCAGDREQAKIVFLEACRMVELDEELGDGSLAAACTVRKAANTIFGPRGSKYRALSAEAYTKEGLNPSCVIFDEVHVQPDDALWNVMTLGSAARERPLVLGITTAGHDKDTLCGRLYDLGKRGVPGFFFRWWEAPAGCDHTDPAVWRMCNPGLTGSPDLLPGEDGFLSEAAIRDELYGSEATSENAFRRYRLNQWTTSAEAWLPAGAWEACASGRRLQPGEQCVLAFDGSHSNDSTGLAAATADGHIETIAVWERPSGPAATGWRVNRAEVMDALRDACRKYDVLELNHDPFRWTNEMQTLEAEGLPIVEFPQGPARMLPATEGFFRAVVDGRISHPGDEPMTRHMGNVNVVQTRQGQKLQKEHPNSTKKIDLAICAVMAYQRATQIEPPPPATTMW